MKCRLCSSDDKTMEGGSVCRLCDELNLEGKLQEVLEICLPKSFQVLRIECSCFPILC